MHTTEQAAPDQLRGPASTAGRPWPRRGWEAGGDNARGEAPANPGRGQINNQVWRGKRKERGERREKTLQDKTVGRSNDLSFHRGKWGEGESKLRREDGKNCTGKNLPMKIYFAFLYHSVTLMVEIIQIQIFYYTKEKN